MTQTTQPTSMLHAADIDALAWMAGSWYGAVDGDAYDEHWSLPAGGVMIGMFRWLKDGKVHMYELMAIEPEADGLALRLKHFHRGLAAWEEKDVVLTYPLIDLGENRATFAKGGAFRSTQFVYRRDGPDQLVAVQENRKGDERALFEFRYRRC